MVFAFQIFLLEDSLAVGLPCKFAGTTVSARTDSGHSAVRCPRVVCLIAACGLQLSRGHRQRQMLLCLCHMFLGRCPFSILSLDVCVDPRSATIDSRPLSDKDRHRLLDLVSFAVSADNLKHDFFRNA